MNAIFLAVLLNAFGPEAELSAPQYARNPFEHSNPEVAASATQYLVAYQDRRGDDTGWRAGDNLMLTRVTPAGVVLDHGGIELELPGPQRDSVALASDGTDFLVVYSETTDFNEAELRLARIAADGSVLTPPAVIRAATKVDHGAPSVCFDGTEYRLVFQGYQDATGVNTLYAARISKAGAVIGAPVALPVPATRYARWPQVACRAAGSLVGWLESDATVGEVRVVAWSSAGALSAASSITRTGANAVQSLALAAGTTGFLAAWEEQRAPVTGHALVAQALTAAGARTTTGDTPVLAAAAGVYRYPRLVFDGAAFRLMVQQLVSNVAQVGFGTLSPAAAVTSPIATVTSTGSHYPGGLDCGSSGCLTAWTEGSSLAYQVGATRLSAANAVLDTPAFPVSTPSDEQTNVRLAWDGAQLLVAWLDSSGTSPAQILARRRDAAGTWLDAAPLVLSAGPGVGLEVAPLPQGGFMVVHSRKNAASSFRYDTQVTIVSRTGALSSPAALLATNADFIPYRLDCPATECLLVGGVDYRLDLSGNPLGQVTLPFQGWTYVVGQEYWSVSNTPQGQSPMGLVIRRYSLQLQPVGQPLVLATPNEKMDQGVVLAPTAAGVTLVWSGAFIDPVTQQPTGRMKVARVDSTAQTVLDAPRDLFLSTNNGWLEPQALIADGNDAWLIWYANDGEALYWLRAQQLTQSLSLVGTPQPLTQVGLNLTRAAAARVAPGNVVVGYVARDSRPERGSHRAKLRGSTAGTLLMQGAPCAGASACASGFCVDGVCCDSACGGSAANDCQACSVSAGAARDGTCAPRRDHTVCRAPMGGCDVAEWCDGTQLQCPADTGAMCMPDAGVPDAGTSEPPDAGAPMDADAGSGSDGGIVLQPPGDELGPARCGCGASGAPALLLLSALVLRRRRAALA